MSQLRRERKRAKERLPVRDYTGEPIPPRPAEGCRRQLVVLEDSRGRKEELTIEYPRNESAATVAGAIAEYLRSRELIGSARTR